MFGATNPFGQSSSSSPFGSQQPVFGQTSAPSNNPFAPNPFGSTTTFGSPQTGSSMFGGTATGMFGTPQTSSPFSSGSNFGVASSPAFGASSTPAFGSTSSAFGGSSAFGQKPAFGGFGTSTQASPFGSTTPQSQSAFGSGLFGSTTPFGGSTQPAFGASSTPAFGSTNTTAFGATTNPSFGSTTTAFGSTASPAFGSTTPGFGVSNNAPVFGSGAAFGSSNTSNFGQPTTPSFGSSSTPAFGVSGATGFGSSTTPFGNVSSSPAFGSPNPNPTAATPSFSFSSGTGFGQSTSPFGSSTPFGSTGPPSFGGQSSSFGVQTTTPAFGTGFGQSAPAGQRGGSRVAPYAPTADTEGSGSAGQAGKLESISAMPVYKDKSHEELRWEDYQLGDKGGPAALGASSGGTGFGASVTPSIGQSTNPFSASTSPNPFAAKPQTIGSSPFPSQSSNPFQSGGSFGVSTSAFSNSSSPSPFGITSQSTFGSTPSVFASTTSTGTASPFGSPLNFNNPQGGAFQSTTPSLGQSGSAFGQTGSAFGQTSSAFGQTGSTFGQTGSAFGQTGSAFAPTGSAFGQTGSAFGQSNMFNTSSGFGGGSGSLFPSSTSLMPSANNTSVFGQSSAPQSNIFQPSQAGAFSFTNLGQTQGGGTSNLGGASSIFGQSNLGQIPATPNSVVQPLTVANPFGTLPAMPQMSIGRAGTTPSLQYGISTMPVVEKPAPVRISSLLTSRHLSQRRIKMPAKKYNPKHDGPKVPFFSDEEETPSKPKADALFIPRENPRALVIRPVDQWPSRTSAEKATPLKKGASVEVQENGKSSEAVDDPSSSGASAREKNRTPAENGVFKDRTHNKLNQKANGVNEEHASQKEEPYMTLSGHRAGEAAIVYEHGADIEALMPKLRRSDYYTEPRIQELAAKERAEPGFCCRVKDFVVGRHGCGSIKFLGETDVRRLDLESIIQFNNREVIVYLDDSKKPAVGQGLNKPAVVTLLNIKCFDKKTGSQVTEGAKIERYKDMLKRKAEEQGAEFISYDPVKGEWKFKANHFSKYKLSEDDDEEDFAPES